MQLLPTLWLIFTFLTLLSTLIYFIPSFFNTMITRKPLFFAIVLHFLCAYKNINQSQSNIIPLYKKILSDNSIHIGVLCIFYFLIGNCSSFWLIYLGLSTFNQFISFLVQIVFSRSSEEDSFSSLVSSLYHKLNDPPYFQARQILSYLEILNIIPSFSFSFILSFFYIIFYIIWFLMYRYAVDSIHQNIWSQARGEVMLLATKLPNRFSNSLVKITCIFSRLSFYSVKLYSINCT